MKYFLKIKNVDVSNLVTTLKVGYETLVASNSGRNAAGDTVIDIVNHKQKIYVGFRAMSQQEMKTLLSAVADYVVNIEYLDPKTGVTKTISTYTGTPEPEYYWIQDNNILYKPMSLNFIEL